jgi:hypothetical protein
MPAPIGRAALAQLFLRIFGPERCFIGAGSLVSITTPGFGVLDTFERAVIAVPTIS